MIEEKKLCPKGRAYYNRRIAAGEVPSAYLSGRAVKVCKGLMEETGEMITCNNCGWEWELEDGGKDPFVCHKCGHDNVEKYDMNESLHDWFKKEDWVRIDTQGNITGPCGTMKKGQATTRCLPRAKANSLSKEERAATARKKANADRKGDRVVSNTPKAKVRLKEDLSQTKIVDEDGNPLIVYRSQEDERVQGVDRQSNTKGIYFSANADSTKIYGPITKKYYLNIKNPLILKDKEWNLSVLPAYYYDMLVKKGYDGAAWLRQGEMYEIIAFYPEQIVPVSDNINEAINPLGWEPIIKAEEGEIERTAEDLGLPYDVVYNSLVNGNEVTLNDDMWSRLENTDSYDINSEEEAIKLAQYYGKDYQSIMSAEKLPPALILQYSPNKFYLIGGNTRLMFARSKDINPQVILGTIEPSNKYAYQDVNDIGANLDEEIDDYDVESEEDYEGFIMFMKEYSRQLTESKLTEAEYHGRKVQLGKIMQGDIKKFKVYVKNDKGKIVKVNFGFGGKSAKGKRMVIKAKNPKRRAAYRARHNCSNPGPRWKANYWSCKKW
jgi:hypothetical protein